MNFNGFNFVLFSIDSASIENGTLISHDLHNALVMKNEQAISQQQPIQQQNTSIAVTSSVSTATTNNGTTTASHSGSSGRSTPKLDGKFDFIYLKILILFGSVQC